MGVYVTDAGNPLRSMKCNWWNRRPIAQLVIASGLLSDEDKPAFEDGHGGLDEEQTRALAVYFRGNILPQLAAGERIRLDGRITTEPDDGTFHRETLLENHSVPREILEEFVEFIETSKGFDVT